MESKPEAARVGRPLERSERELPQTSRLLDEVRLPLLQQTPPISRISAGDVGDEQAKVQHAVTVFIAVSGPKVKHFVERDGVKIDGRGREIERHDVFTRGHRRQLKEPANYLVHPSVVCCRLEIQAFL